ncbi:MAG: tetratricopeptide repeat protein [Elusimicrobiales bacterium]|nr:tetratricopeptide repeat protein [Elusimicrobiales bacterium]
MKRFTVMALLPAALVPLTGCLATEAHVDDLRRQMNALNSSISQMQKNQADINAKMDTLSRDLTSHSENLHDFDRELSKVSAKLDDIQTVFDTRFSDLGKNIKGQLDESKKREDAAVRAADETARALLPSKVYGDAYALLLKKNYERAAQGFSVYLEKFPNGEFVESAYYYMGDAYWSLGGWKDSAVAYATMLQKFPASQFTPAARLRYAQCLLKLGGDKKEAQTYLQSIVRDYPDSQQARLAQDYLRDAVAPAAKAPAKKWQPAAKHSAKKR